MSEGNPTAAEQLTAVLRTEILRGELTSGSPLREEELANRTGHSRHTVRTALAVLVAERLAVAETYRGVRVTSFTSADAVALQQLRAALEVEAVRLLRERHGTRWPEPVLAPVRAAIATMSRQPVDDWPAVAAAHAAVHGRLVAAADSPRLIEAHHRLHAEMLLLLVHVRPAYDVARLVAEHQEFLDHVQTQGEPAVRRHLDHSTQLILAARAAWT